MGLFSKDIPANYEIDEKMLQCFFCGNKTFYRKRSYLNSAFRWALNMQLTNNFICSKCSYVHTFLR